MSADLSSLQQAASTEAATHTTQAQSALAVIESLTIDSDLMFETAGEELRAIKTRLSTLEAARLNITRPMDAAKKAVMDLFKGPVALLEKAEGTLKTKMLAYSQEQARKRAEEQAERERLARLERERLEREAAALAAAGKAEEAAVKQEVAQMVTAPVAAEAPKPKAAGISTVERWTFEVKDKAAMIAYVAAHPEYLDCLDVNSAEVRRLALAMKDKLPLAGVRVFKVESLAARGS